MPKFGFQLDKYYLFFKFVLQQFNDNVFLTKIETLRETTADRETGKQEETDIAPRRTGSRSQPRPCGS